jgi:hypothetical protein
VDAGVVDGPVQLPAKDDGSTAVVSYIVNFRTIVFCV